MATVKTVGRSGLISFGKQYAGHHVLVDEIEPGVWVIKVGEFIPDSERWLLNPQVSAELDRAISWAAQHPPQETDLKALKKRLR